MTLYTGLAVFLDQDTQQPSLLPTLTTSQVGNLLVLLALLLTCVKIPSLMRRYVLRGGGRSGARMVGVLVLQQLTRGLGRTRATTRPRPATAARPPGRGPARPAGRGGRP